MAIGGGGGGGTATLFSATVNLAKAQIGAGILTLPWCFGQCGVLMAVIVLSTCCMLQIFALHIFAIVSVDANDNGQDISFRQLSKAAFRGSKYQRSFLAFVELCVISFTYGCAVSYFIVIGDVLPEVMEYFEVDYFPWTSRHFWMTFLGVCYILPLSFFRSMTTLKVASIIGNFSILYIVFVIFMCASNAVPVAEPQQPLTFWPPEYKSTSLAGRLESTSLFVFSYGCVTSLPALVCEMQNPTLRRVDTMIFLSMGFTYLVYISIGIFGCYTWGSTVSGNVMIDFPIKRGTLGGNLSIFSRVAIVFNVSGSIALEDFILRQAVSQIFFQKSQKDLTTNVNAIVAVCIFCTTWGMAMLLTSITDVMAFVGATCNNFLGFTFPCLFYVLSERLAARGTQSDVQLSLQGGSADVAFDGQGADAGTSTARSRFSLAKFQRKASWALIFVSIAGCPVLVFAQFFRTVKAH